MSADVHDAAALLRERGLRVTASRVAVLDVIRTMEGHPDADAVRVAVTERLGSVSTQAVYDILHTPHGGRPAAQHRAGRAPRALRDARRRQPSPPGLPRVRCARATSTAPSADTPCLSPSQHGGFVIDEAEVIFWGLCADCRHANHAEKGTE